MPCRAPLQAWWSRYRNKYGNHYLVFKHDRRTCAEPQQVGCGRCPECQLDKTREWGIRCAHEAQILEEEDKVYSTFVTLTYSEKHLPDYGSLVPEDMQKLMKKLREHLWRKQGRKVRYYYSGEYGTRCPKHEIHDCPVCGEIQRPHYHMLLFGFDFPDRKFLYDREGLNCYESDFLHDLWPLGFHEIGSVSFQSAAYTARYCMKKLDRNDYEGRYLRHCPWRDNWYEVHPEFGHMSKDPGIGSRYFDKYWQDMYPSDECYVSGRGVMGKPPAYYDKKLGQINPEMLEEVKAKRRECMEEIEEKRKTGDAPSLASMAMNTDARVSKLIRSM